MPDPASALLDDPEQVKVNVIEGANSLVIELSVSKEDIGKIIGKHGRTADALRIVLTAVGAKTRNRGILEVIEQLAGGGEQMEVGESVQGKDLVLTEKDLLVMRGDDHMIHIVCDGRICRPNAIDGILDRGVRLWTKVGSCKRHEDFEIEVLSLEGKTCKRCVKMLKRNGIVLRKV